MGRKARLGDQGADDLGKDGPLLRVAQRAARVERILSTRNGQFQVDHSRAIAVSTLRSSACAQMAPTRLVLAPTTAMNALDWASRPFPDNCLRGKPS